MTLEEQTIGPTAAPILDYARDPTRPSKWGKGFLAVAGTFVHPGLGHALIARSRRAVFWATVAMVWEGVGLAALIHPMGLPIAALAIVMATLTLLAALVDGFICGRNSPRRLLGRPWLRYATGVALIAAAMSISPISLSNYRLAQFIKQRYTQSFVLQSSSMVPTLAPGDRFLVHKRAQWRRWSMVVFEHPQYGAGAIASRVVGLPGETVEIVGGQIKINGAVTSPPQGIGPWTNVTYHPRMNMALNAKPGAGCEGNPIHLGPDEYFVLGDNSTKSLDARLWEVAPPGHQLGALPASLIKGRITWIYWPAGRWRYFD